MTQSISAQRLASLVGDFDQSPAYAGLAEAVTLLIGDGRISLETRLPSERELSTALGLSRTTVTRAYASLVAGGYAVAQQGAGTFTRVPGGRKRAHDRALLPRPADGEAIDLNCAATSAPPGVAAAYAAALGDLPAYLGGHGYFPAGLPELQTAIATAYAERGLPTRPEQILVTPGALSAAAIVAQALTGRGDRVMVESPVYPNAVEAIRHAGARLVAAPVDPSGWDLEATLSILRQTSPRLAYLIPDFQNPTGLVMSAEQRETYATALRAAGTTPVVDEAHQGLELDGHEQPPPFAVFAPETITIGSASKSFWGGLRLGWIRSPLDQLGRLTAARVRLDLGVPVMEQLAFTHLLRDPEPVTTAHKARLREQRAALVAALHDRLPEWTFRVPSGGLCLWCELPAPMATEVVAESERRGVIVAPGPAFAVEGGLDRFLRLPYTRPAPELRQGVDVPAVAWRIAQERHPRSTTRDTRVIVA